MKFSKRIIRGCFGFVKKLEALGYIRWSREVKVYANECLPNVASSFCKLSCAIKTHKPAGETAARAIHTSSNHSLNALGEVVNRLLTPVIRKFVHVAWSSEDVQSILKETMVSSRTN